MHDVQYPFREANNSNNVAVLVREARHARRHRTLERAARDMLFFVPSAPFQWPEEPPHYFKFTRTPAQLALELV
jgi:hypothetical protein